MKKLREEYSSLTQIITTVVKLLFFKMIHLKVSSSLSSESTDVTLLKSGLHDSFGDKNKYVIRNVAAELEILAIVQDRFVNVSFKERFQKCLRSTINIITNNIYTDKNRTVKFLNLLRKNYNIFILSVDK